MNTHTDTLITVLHSSIGGGVISTSDRRCNVSSQLLCSSESHSIILKLLLSANHKLSDMNLSPYTVRNHSSSETLALYVAAKWKRGFKTPSWEPLRDMTCHVLVNPCCKVSLQAVHLSRHNSLSWDSNTMQRLYSSSEAWPSQVWKLQIKSSCIHANNFRFQTTAHYRQGRIQTSVMLLVMFCVSDNDKRHQCLEDCGIWLHVTSENANDSTATTHNWSATRHFKQDIAQMAARGYAPTDSWMYILYQKSLWLQIPYNIVYCFILLKRDPAQARFTCLGVTWPTFVSFV